MLIANLWVSTDQKSWENALDRYWSFVLPGNLSLEQSLDALNLEYLRQLDAAGWYDFLLNKYFRWKYTAPNRYATTTKSIKDNSLADLNQIRKELLEFDSVNVSAGLKLATKIRGLGVAGASGLLALMYPKNFGTVDQFVVKALRQVEDLPEASALARMNPESLKIRDGVLIIDLLRRKAAANNEVFNSDTWTPRKLDKVLWTYGR
jgi:hypothetical protein